MTTKTLHGSCHCGAVRFETDIDLGNGSNKCNCSYCTKARAWFAFVPGTAFRLQSGAEALSEYRWTPPGKPEPFLTYAFCKTCASDSTARATIPSRAACMQSPFRRWTTPTPTSSRRRRSSISTAATTASTGRRRIRACSSGDCQAQAHRLKPLRGRGAARLPPATGRAQP